MEGYTSPFKRINIDLESEVHQILVKRAQAARKPMKYYIQDLIRADAAKEVQMKSKK